MKMKILKQKLFILKKKRKKNKKIRKKFQIKFFFIIINLNNIKLK